MAPCSLHTLCTPSLCLSLLRKEGELILGGRREGGESPSMPFLLKSAVRLPYLPERKEKKHPKTIWISDDTLPHMSDTTWGHLPTISEKLLYDRHNPPFVRHFYSSKRHLPATPVSPSWTASSPTRKNILLRRRKKRRRRKTGSSKQKLGSSVKAGGKILEHAHTLFARSFYPAYLLLAWVGGNWVDLNLPAWHGACAGRLSTPASPRLARTWHLLSSQEEKAAQGSFAAAFASSASEAQALPRCHIYLLISISQCTHT